MAHDVLQGVYVLNKYYMIYEHKIYKTFTNAVDRKQKENHSRRGVRYAVRVVRVQCRHNQSGTIFAK